jgi:hypothetical protein
MSKPREWQEFHAQGSCACVAERDRGALLSFSGVQEKGAGDINKARSLTLLHGFGKTHEGDYMTQNEAQGLGYPPAGYACHP